MKQFTGTQKKEHAEIIERMQTAKQTLEEAVEACNEKFDAAYAPIELAINEFNQQLADAYEQVETARAAYLETLEAGTAFIAGVREDAQSYFDDRSEAWQEGEKGEAYQDWINELDDVNLDAPELDQPTELDMPDRPELAMPDFDAIDTFEGIRQGVEE